MKAIPFLIAAIALPAIAFANEDAYPYQHGGLGEVIVAGDRMLVVPLAVVEDSRCPIEALCLHPGNLVLKVELRSIDKSGQSFTSLGEYTVALRTPLKVNGGTLTLTDVAPPRSSNLIAPADYRFRIVFEGWRD